MAKSKKTLSEPNLTILDDSYRGSRDLQPQKSHTPTPPLMNNRRKKLDLFKSNISSLSAFLKRILCKNTTKSDIHKQKLDKQKSRSYDNFLMSKVSPNIEDKSRMKNNDIKKFPIQLHKEGYNNNNEMDFIRLHSELNICTSSSISIQNTPTNECNGVINNSNRGNIVQNEEFLNLDSKKTRFKKQNSKFRNFDISFRRPNRKLDTDNINNIRHLSDTALFRVNQDLTNLEEKYPHHNDKTLTSFLASQRCGRRYAICSKIDKIYNNRQLINYMEYLLREDYIRNFLL